MSKRLKNYPSPIEVIDDYGADALRLYIINSLVVHAEPLRFKKEGVYGIVIRDFKMPDHMTEKEIDATGDGDVLVILDLRLDNSLLEAGVAREVVNRIQKLRKKAALEPTDMVEVYFKSLDEDDSISRQILDSQNAAVIYQGCA